MARNIVILCDGTGNEIAENQSNVLKFYRVLKKDDEQLAFYDPGIGTISDSNAWSVFRSRAKGVFGLLTGYGLDANILDAYRFLARAYREGDAVYLFGFSRGAHTVRVLAGFIHMVGLLQPHQLHLAGYALTAYKRSSRRDDFGIAWRVQEVLDSRRITIRFLGCWDTVASVIVPRPDRLYIPSLETLPYTLQNPSVQAFRQAIAVDERRRMFRLSPWREPQKFKTNPFVSDEDAADQDISQVWFAGVHADIGGGYRESESGAAKLPLAWMVEQGRAHGLVYRETMVDRLVYGRNPQGSSRHYVAPDPHAPLHQSMNAAWRVLEYLPKRARHREWPGRRIVAGFYLPRGEPRFIAADAAIDPSVRERQRTRPGEAPYAPVNLPPDPDRPVTRSGIG